MVSSTGFLCSHCCNTTCRHERLQVEGFVAGFESQGTVCALAFNIIPTMQWALVCLWMCSQHNILILEYLRHPQKTLTPPTLTTHFISFLCDTPSRGNYSSPSPVGDPPNFPGKESHSSLASFLPPCLQRQLCRGMRAGVNYVEL